MIDCTVSVINANGEPIKDADVRLGTVLGSTSPDGRWTTTVDPQGPISLGISHPFYVPERASFLGDLRTAAWDNGLVRRDVTDSSLSLSVTLGRIDTSPTVELPESRVEAIAKTPPADPSAALVFRPPRFRAVKAYRFHWNTERTVRVARPALLPDPPFEALPQGWARFQNDQIKVDTAALGRFYWVEYPQRPNSPKSVVAIWSPNLSTVQPLIAMDFVVFFSPHTASYVARYPYGLVPKTKPPDQQYTTLGKKYLVDEYFFVQQLIARRNPSVVVMPICNHGDWEPFTSGEGLLRLLREVAVFLHRQCRTSRRGNMEPTADPDALCGLNQRTVVGPLTSTSFGAVPRVGRVAIGGFSTGIAIVKKIMTSWPVSLSRALWGISGKESSSPQQLWTKSWRELWDLDGYHPQTGGWPHYLDLLETWYGETADRIVRLYHSSGRVPPDPTTDTHKLYKLMLNAGIKLDRSVPPTTGVGWARIMQGDRWTIVRMANSYVDHGPTNEAPPFDDAHHTTPRIGFSHAAGLTTLGK